MTLVLPQGACDTHCHLFGPLDRFPLPASARYTPPAGSLEMYEQLQARFGLSRAVFVQSVAYGRDHAPLLDALVRGKGRYAGVALVDEQTTDAELTIFHEAGVRAARFHFMSHLGDDADTAAIDRVVARIAPLGWHVLLHVDGPALERYAEYFAQLPVPYIIDHMGRVQASDGVDGGAFRTLLALLQNPRAWVKISAADRISATAGPPYADVVPLARALVDAAPERVLWGTDWPHTNVRAMPDDADLVALLEQFVPDARTRDMILVDNPQRLYDFGER
jgi:2-pyrone-4,6-dicarboxylate lactonase